MSDQTEYRPTEQNIENFNLLKKMLDTLSIQVAELSRKKPDTALNLTKIEMINRVLKPLKEEIFLHEPSATFLDLLNETNLPSNSDAVLIMSQYKTAAKEFTNTHYSEYRGGWMTQEAALEEEEEEENDFPEEEEEDSE